MNSAYDITYFRYPNHALSPTSLLRHPPRPYRKLTLDPHLQNPSSHPAFSVSPGLWSANIHNPTSTYRPVECAQRPVSSATTYSYRDLPSPESPEDRCRLHLRHAKSSRLRAWTVRGRMCGRSSMKLQPRRRRTGRWSISVKGFSYAAAR